jgi:hypothetical protein
MNSYDLNLIKKDYGETLAKLCRDNFPTLLKSEGLLYKLISQNFAKNKNLGEDLKKSWSENFFVSFIYSLLNKGANINSKEQGTKSAKEMFEDCGYTLSEEILSEEELMKYIKYYAPSEKLCTFTSIQEKKFSRLKDFRIWFAIKHNANDIKRENFLYPQRQDEYGTSVLCIQVSKTHPFISIKNRYNHTVDACDSTFNNNLDNIKQGLTKAFFIDNKINFEKKFVSNFSIPNYTKANDNKFYSYNLEQNGTFFCGDNFIIQNGEPKQFNKQFFVLIENYLVNIKDKTITNLIDNNSDSFIQSMGEIAKISIESNEEKNRVIKVKNTNNQECYITINNKNQLISYKNNFVTRIENHFLSYNTELTNIELNNLESCGKFFLCKNLRLKEICFQNLYKAESFFIESNKTISKAILPKLLIAGNSFLSENYDLEEYDFENLKTINGNFLSNNKKIKTLKLNCVTIGSNSLIDTNIEEFICPNLISCGKNVLRDSTKVKNLYAPNLTDIDQRFLEKNTSLKNLKLAKKVNLHDNCFKMQKDKKLLFKGVTIIADDQDLQL